MKPIWFWMSGFLVCAPLFAEEAQDGGQVTLPYASFRALLDQASPVVEPQAPPVAAAFVEAGYEIDLRGSSPRVTASWTAENFSGAWEWVAVAPAGLAVRPDEGATLVADGKHLRMLLPEKGRSTVKARFAAGSSGPVAARFQVVPSASNHLLLKHDGAATDFVIDGAEPLPGEAGEIRYLLPATVTEVIVRRAEKDDDRPARWEISSEAWVGFESGWLEHEVVLHANLIEGSGRELQLQFPNGPMRIHAEGPGLSEFRMQDGLTLRWDASAPREREVHLQYRLPVAENAADWTPRIPFAKEDAGHSLIVIHVPSGAIAEGPGWDLHPQPGQLPAWIRERPGQNPVAVHRNNPSPSVGIRWLPRVETATMTIPQAKLITRVVADGSQLTEAVYQIELANSGSARWTLPEGMQLLESAVNGTRVRPVSREGALEFDLPAPSGQKPVEVRFSYTGSGKPLDRVAGGLLLQSPSTPLFAHRIDWGIGLPDGVRLEAVESNAEAVPAPEPGHQASTWLRRSLTRDSALRAELFYRTRALEE